MSFKTIGNGYGNTLTVSAEFYEERCTASYSAYLNGGGDSTGWAEVGQQDFEADLYEEMLQNLIDLAEAEYEGA